MARGCDGINDSIEFGTDVAGYNATDISVVCWFQENSSDNANDRLMECGGFSNTDGWGMEIPAVTTTYLNATWNAGAGNTVTIQAYSNDTWFHNVLTSDSSTPLNEGFFNGVSSGSDDITRGTGIQDIVVGARNANPSLNNSSVKISQMAIYQRILSDAAILGLAHGACPFALDPDGFYCPFDGNDSPEPDFVTHNTGTVTGAIKFTPNAPCELMENYL